MIFTLATSQNWPEIQCCGVPNVGLNPKPLYSMSFGVHFLLSVGKCLLMLSLFFKQFLCCINGKKII
jgi:hypothetical protein